MLSAQMRKVGLGELKQLAQGPLVKKREELEFGPEFL